jgi:hypothetical protein
MPPTNPTVIAALTTNRYDFINPVWMLKTLAYFPTLAALWFLLLVPGAGTMGGRWNLLPPATLVVAVLGLWSAAAGTGLMTWLFSMYWRWPSSSPCRRGRNGCDKQSVR